MLGWKPQPTTVAKMNLSLQKLILLQFLSNKQVCTLRIIMDTDLLIPTRIRNFRIAQERLPPP